MKRLSVCIAMCALATFAALAQQQWKIGINGNALIGGNLEQNKGLGFGGHLQYLFMDMYSAELSVNGYKARNRDYDATSDMSILAAVLAIKAHLVPKGYYPGVYAGLGAGIYAIDEKDKDNGDSYNAFRPSAIIGMDYALNDSWGLFGDYRYTFMNLQFQDHLDHGLLRLGVNYGF